MFFNLQDDTFFFITKCNVNLHYTQNALILMWKKNLIFLIGQNSIHFTYNRVFHFLLSIIKRAIIIYDSHLIVFKSQYNMSLAQCTIATTSSHAIFTRPDLFTEFFSSKPLLMFKQKGSIIFISLILHFGCVFFYHRFLFWVK